MIDRQLTFDPKRGGTGGDCVERILDLDKPSARTKRR